MCALRLREGRSSDEASPSEAVDSRDRDGLADVFAASAGDDRATAGWDELDALWEFAAQAGLDVIDVDLPDRMVVLGGPAQNVSQAFGVQLVRYKYGGTVRCGYVGSVSVPPVLAPLVEEFCGVEDQAQSTQGLPAAGRVWASSLARPNAVVAGLVLLVGSALGALLFGNYFNFGKHFTVSRPGRAAAPLQVPAPVRAPHLLSPVQGLETAGRAALRSGRLPEAQDDFLRALSLDDRSVGAMDGLVAVRRKMSADNAQLIRRQLAIYEDAIAQGTTTGEYYTPSSLRFLVAANRRALVEIEGPGALKAPAAAPAGQAAVAGSPAVPVTAAAIPAPPVKPAPHPPVTTAQPNPPRSDPRPPAQPVTPSPAAARPAAQPVAIPPKTVSADRSPAVPGERPVQDRPAPPAAGEAPRPVVPAAPQVSPPRTAPGQGATGGASQPTPGATPAPSPQAVPAVVSAPEPSAAAPNQFVAVRIGPFTDRDRAAAISARLSAAGFSQARVDAMKGYWVVSEPLPRTEAERLVPALAGRGFHPYLSPAGGNTVQLIFGAFTSQQGADALVSRVAAAGYDAWLREGTVYLMHLGPYPSAAVKNITEIVKGAAPEATIAGDPVP